MLEILLLYALGKNIAEKAENQGRGGALFVIILIVLWVLGEIVGAFVGVIVTGEKLYAYLFALVGAAVGAVLAYTFLAVLPLFESAMQERPRPPRRRRRPRPRRTEDRDDEGRAERRRRKDEDDEVYEDLAVEDEAPAPEPAESGGYEVIEEEGPKPRRKRMPRRRLDD